MSFVRTKTPRTFRSGAPGGIKAQDAAGVASTVNLRKVRRVGGAAAGLLLALLTFLVVGIASTSLPALAQERLRVVATSRPIHSIAAAVLGDKGPPELLITGMASPHTYALTPSNARQLHQADVFIRVSEQVEPFTQRIARALPGSVEVVTLADTPGLKRLPVRISADFDGHPHFDGDDHDHEPEAGAVDGHVWLDPENAKLMGRRLAEVFAARWPNDGQAFAANADRFAADVDAASGEIAAELAPVTGVPFVVFHDAYHYFEERFGLKAAGAISINPEVPPGARHLSALRQRIEKLGGVCVFAEPQFNARVLDAVVAGTGARSGVLDPIGVDLEPGPGLYTAMLKGLAGGFTACLAQEPKRAGR